MGSVNDIDLGQLYDDSKSPSEGALTVPGYTADGWHVKIFAAAELDSDKPIKKFTKQERHNFRYKESTKVKVAGVNLTYEGLIPRIQKSFLSKDVDVMQPHIRAFVERAVTFTTCPDCGGTRLNEAARSSKVKKKNIAEACAMQINELAEWTRGVKEPFVAPLLASLRHTLESFVEIGLGYRSLDRPSGRHRGRQVFQGTVDGLRASGTLTGCHLSDRAVLKPSVRKPARRANHRVAPGRPRAVARAARPAGRLRQVGHRNRAPSVGDGARRLDHRPRARRGPRGWADRVRRYPGRPGGSEVDSDR
jgi:hypothetical protein